MARAQIVETPEEEETNNEEVESFAEEQEQQQEVAQELPEKYQGKSMEDLVAMHQNAEKLLGKQSSEVGELRKVVDDFIAGQSSTKETEQPQQEEDDVDFFVDPKTAVSRAIDNHPKVKEAEQYSTQYKRQTALSQLQGKHPEMQEILQDNNFAEWVKASKIRTQLFVQADQGYDYEAADELFSLWKERAGVAKQTAELEKQSRKQQLKSANTGNARGSGEGPRKKVYRRADIIKLMRDDPERYQSLSDDIMRAYQEGRVK